jgi:hypothetical protein
LYPASNRVIRGRAIAHPDAEPVGHVMDIRVDPPGITAAGDRHFFYSPLLTEDFVKKQTGDNFL